VHAWGSTSLSLAFCCVSLELNSRFRNYPIVPTILRNVACKFRNYPMVSTIPIMCACAGFLSSNRELYGTYTAYSTRNSFNPGASWGPESALESGFENPCHSGHGPRVRIGIWIRKPQPCIANAISLCEMSRASTLKAIGNAIGVLFSNVDSPPPRGGPSPHQHLDSGLGPAPPPFPPRVHIGWGRYAGKRKVIELFACHCRTKHALMFC